MTSPDPLHDLAAKGLRLAARGKVREAIPPLTEAVVGGVQNEEVLEQLSLSLQRMNGPARAAQILAEILTRAPMNTGLRIEAAKGFSSLYEYEAELQVCAEGVEAGDPSPELALYYARALRNFDRHEEALEITERVAAAHASNPVYQHFLGTLLYEAGRLEEAKAAHARAVKTGGFPASFYSYCRISKRDDFIESELPRVREKLSSANAVDAGFLHGALGKLAEDSGGYGEAFEHYHQMGQAIRTTTRYDRQYTEAMHEALRRAFPAEVLAAPGAPAEAGKGRVFIVGMPRSGSTLVERILEAHPATRSVGEVSDLWRVASPTFEMISRSGQPDWSALQHQYAELAEKRSHGAAPVMIDKTLSNFTLIGFIHKMFPGSTILHTTRHPLDTCISCFSIHFGKTQEWSNSLSDLAHYYGEYRRMMAYWEAALPGRIVTVSNETLVANVEEKTRAIVAACGLEWDPACLEFHNQKSVVKTVSGAQVREPVNAKSVERWRRFEPYLGELQRDLAEWL